MGVADLLLTYVVGGVCGGMWAMRVLNPVWLLLFGSSFAVYLLESAAVRRFGRELVRLLGKVW